MKFIIHGIQVSKHKSSSVDFILILSNIAGKGGLFRNRRYASVKDFTAPSVVEWMEPSLALRNAVNKEIGCLNTQEWDVTIVVSSLEDLKLLQVNFDFSAPVWSNNLKYSCK